MVKGTLPLPIHYDADKVGDLWRVPYQERFIDALGWAKLHGLSPAFEDATQVCLILVDVQNTFCLPNFELFVRGRSGTGAVDDNIRLCEFIYRNLNSITQITPTLDTHQAVQIFHSIFLVDKNGEHPLPFTLVTEEDIQEGHWQVNPAIFRTLDTTEIYAQTHLAHYVRSLRKTGKLDLTIWPYHAMLGGIGHALVSAVEEAVFFHSIARYSQPDFRIKGDYPLTEHYSVLGPEVMEDVEGKTIGRRDDTFIQKLFTFDRIIIAGQAKSHCVAWTISDLLKDILTQDESLARKIYLLEDCTSPVVIEGVIDYSDAADDAFSKFMEAGMNVVQSTTPILDWP